MSMAMLAELLVFCAQNHGHLPVRSPAIFRLGRTVQSCIVGICSDSRRVRVVDLNGAKNMNINSRLRHDTRPMLAFRRRSWRKRRLDNPSFSAHSQPLNT